ncbi:MAG: PDZ domain-containing protein [Oscillospiraceae bacterium]|nr:PDZ domain-containing protein [Oscillospiraceae bacterium]
MDDKFDEAPIRHEHVIIFPKMGVFHRIMLNSALVAIWAVIVSGAVYFVLSGAFGLVSRAAADNRAKSGIHGGGNDNIPSFNVPQEGDGFSYDFGGGNRERDENGLPHSFGGDNAPALKAGLGVTVEPFVPQSENDAIQGGLAIVYMADENAFAGTDVKVHDIITAVEGGPVKEFEDLRKVLAAHEAGDKLTLTIARYTKGVPESRDYEVALVKLGE